MGSEQIVNRIISDAESEAEEILAAAKVRAGEIVGEAERTAAKERAAAEEEVAVRVKRICEGREAAARLDSAKILLAEKRRVMDEILNRALNKLLSLGERESVALIARLIKENAERGDEIVFAENFKYAKAVSGLPEVSQMGLTISAERADISGGCILRGKTSDKDISYSSLIAADMEEHLTDIAAKLFAAK